MILDFIQKYAEANQLHYATAVPLSRRKDPIDAQAGAHRPDEEKVDVYLDEKNGVVYKVGPVSYFKRFQTDVKASLIAAQNDISVAVPLSNAETIENKVIYATKYVPHNPEETPEAKVTGKLLARLHNIKIHNQELPVVTSQLPQLVEYALHSSEVASWIKSAVQDRCLPCMSAVIEDLNKNNSLLHGDPHLGNVLPTRESPTFIDFECSGRGSPLWDMAVVIQSSRRLGLDRRWADDCMEGWSSVHTYDPELLDRYVEWRCWYGALSMIKRVNEDVGFDTELTIRLKWLADPTDQSKWTRC